MLGKCTTLPGLFSLQLNEHLIIRSSESVMRNEGKDVKHLAQCLALSKHSVNECLVACNGVFVTVP